MLPFQVLVVCRGNQGAELGYMQSARLLLVSNKKRKKNINVSFIGITLPAVIAISLLSVHELWLRESDDVAIAGIFLLGFSIGAYCYNWALWLRARG